MAFSMNLFFFNESFSDIKCTIKTKGLNYIAIVVTYSICRIYVFCVSPCIKYDGIISTRLSYYGFQKIYYHYNCFYCLYPLYTYRP